MPTRQHRDHRYDVVVGGVVAIIAILGALIVGLAVTGEGDSTPVISLVIGLAGPTIIGMLALINAKDTREDLRNGTVSDNMKRAIKEISHEPESNVTIEKERYNG